MIRKRRKNNDKKKDKKKKKSKKKKDKGKTGKKDETPAEKKAREKKELMKEKEQLKINTEKKKMAELTLNKIAGTKLSLLTLLGKDEAANLPSVILNPCQQALKKLEKIEEDATEVIDKGGKDVQVPFSDLKVFAKALAHTLSQPLWVGRAIL